MRKPFLFLLIIFSFWVWSTDLVDILFYYLKHPYTKLTGGLIAFIPFSILTWLFTKLFFKYYDLGKNSIKLSKEKIKEYLYLFLFFLPILYLNFKRIMFPDVSFDTGAYHLYLQELNRYENLKNFNMVGGGGGGTYFFTLAYKMFGSFRHLLGFRMAPVFNTILLFVCFVSIYDFIKLVSRSYLEKIKIPFVLIALASFFTIYANNTLFVLNAYMVDLIGIPLLFELLFIVLFKKLADENGTVVTCFFFFLVSLLIAYKLTYLPYILVLGLFFIIRNYLYLLKRKKLILLFFIPVFFPSIYMIYNYTETLNPIFPFYNKLFKSSLYPIVNFKDERWGPRNIVEVFYYNIICATDKTRNNEWGIFSVRLLAEYFLIGCCAVYCIYNRFKFKPRFIKLIISICGIALLLNYMLLITTGYYRYGIIVEMLFGLCIVLWLFYFFEHKKYILFTSILLLSFIQCINTFNTIYKHGANVSWYDYKDLWHNNNGEIIKDQAHLLFRDKQTNVDDVVSKLKIDGFLASDCDGYIKLLSPHTPIYNVTSFGNRKEVIMGFEKNVIDTLSQKHNLYSLARMENLAQKIHDLNSRNYFVDSIVNIYPSFTNKELPLYLLKLKHVNIDSFKIVTLDSFIRDTSPGTKENLSYQSKNNFKLFVILDPYSYNQEYKQLLAKFTLNDHSYTLNLPDREKRILVLSGNSQLSFHKQNEFNYLVIIQDLQGINKTAAE